MTPHGTYSGYKHHHCRCQPCRDAHYRYTKAHRLGIAPDLLIDATGTRRRLHALYRMGWDTTTLARMLGVRTGAAVSVLTNRAKVTRATADAVAAIYDRHAMTLGPSTKARQMAIKRDLPGPLAWDETTIDDPDARPDTGTDEPVKGGPRERLHVEDVEWLLDQEDHTWDGLAHRLSVRRHTLDRALRRADRTDLIARLTLNTTGTAPQKGRAA